MYQYLVYIEYLGDMGSAALYTPTEIKGFNKLADVRKFRENLHSLDQSIGTMLYSKQIGVDTYVPHEWAKSR